MTYITGETIKRLREKKKLTQKELAEKLMVSDKTISKWETNKGLPDLSILSCSFVNDVRPRKCERVSRLGRRFC